MSTQAKADILLRINSDVAQLRTAIAEMKNAKTTMGDMAKAGISFGAGFATVQGVISGVTNGFKTMVREVLVEGVRFNATLEQARLGVASVLKTFNPQQYKTFNQAVAASAEVIDQLKKKALETPATFEELLTAYQGTAGAMSKAGIPLKNQVDLMVNISQAMAALGIRSEEMRQEATALMMGNIDRNARLAQTLGITKQHIVTATEQGRLYEFLTNRLKEFAVAGEMAQTNISVLESNLKDAKTQVAADATKELTSAYRELLVALTALVKSEGFKETFAFLSKMTAGVVMNAQAFVDAMSGRKTTTPLGTNRDDSPEKLRARYLAINNKGSMGGELDTIDSGEILHQAQARANASARLYKQMTDDPNYGAKVRKRAADMGYPMYDDGFEEHYKLVEKDKKEYAELVEWIKTAGEQERLNAKSKAEADAKTSAATAKQKQADVETMEKREKLAKHLEKLKDQEADEREKAFMASVSPASQLEYLRGKKRGQESELRSTEMIGTRAFIGSSEDAKDEVVQAQAKKALEAETLRIKKEIEETDKKIATIEKQQEKIAETKLDKTERENAQKAVDAARAALQEQEVNRRRVENNPYLLRDDKREAMRRALVDENAAIENQIKKLEAAKGKTKDESAQRSYDQEIAALGSKRATNTADIDTRYNPQTFSQQLAEQLVQLEDSFRTLAMSITDVIGGATSSLSSSFDGLLQHTMTVGQATQNLFKGIGQSVTKAISDMAAQWVIKHTLMAAVSRIFHTEDAAGHVATESVKTAATLKGAAIRMGVWIKEALASVYAGAVAAFKAMASIPYIGPILGAAAMAAAVIGGMKLVKQMHLADGGVFTGSGRVRGPGHSKEDAVNAKLSDGEVVIQEPSARKIGYDRLLHMNKTGELPEFGGGGLFGKIGAAVGKASGWKTWGQFLGSGGLSTKVTSKAFQKFQAQWNLMDGTKLYGGGPTSAETVTPTSDQLAAAKLERAGTTSANMDYIASLANNSSGPSSVAGSSGGEGGAVSGSAGSSVNLNNYIYFDYSAMMRAVRRDPETRKYITNAAQEAVA